MEFIPAAKYTRGRRGFKPQMIIIHHWDDPAKKPAITGVINWFKSGRGNNSAHYVVEGGRVVQMVSEDNTAWHAGNWLVNLKSIGIELNPRHSDSDYAEAAKLIRDIRARHGDLPLKRHRDVSKKSTGCPGTWDLARLESLARAAAFPPPAPTAPPPAAPATDWLTIGSTGPRVKRLQQGLARVFPAYRRARGRIIADGYYGPVTAGWVNEFQRRTGLYVDGKAGPLTLAALARFGVTL